MAGRYYAHPRNQFWRLIGEAIGADIVSLDYEARLVALRSARVGLWDTVASARREGSLDGALREIEGNVLVDLIASQQSLRAIGFNGAMSARIGRRALAGTQLALINLPSTSPAFAAMSYAEKAQRWKSLREFLW